MDSEQIFALRFPLEELKKLHADLTQLENFLNLSGGPNYLLKDQIKIIYAAQELIESLVSEESRKKREEKKKVEELKKLDLDF